MQSITEHNDKSHFYAAFMFMVWPLLAVVSAFKNYKQGWAKNIFWAFCAFYGFVFAVGAESEGSDIVRYVDEYQILHTQSLTLNSAVEYFQNSGEVDVVRTFIAVVLSRFSDSQAILTLVYGLIFGYFFSRNLWYVLDRLKGHFLPITLILLACYFLINPIWKINGFRMWTATHVFIYGLLPFLFEGKLKSLAWCFVSVLFHFSFIVPVGLLMAYVVIGNRMTFYTVFFVITIFISEINIEVFNNYVESYAPEIIQERSESYRSASQVEAYREGGEQENRNWYVDWYRRGFGWTMIGFILIFFTTNREFFKESANYGWMNLYCFAVFFYGVTNLLSSIPSGGRFLTVVHLITMVLVILYIQNQAHDKWLKRFSIVSLPALLLYLVVSIRIAFYTLSATAVIGNPIVGVFTMGGNISLNDVMRMIL